MKKLLVLLLLITILSSVAFADTNETITVEGDYTISSIDIDIITTDDMNNGWYYYFTDSIDEVAEVKQWEVPNDMYTTIGLIFDLTNLSDNSDTSFTDRFNGCIIYNNIEYPLTALQQNKNQIGENGYEIYNIHGDILNENDTVVMTLRANIDKNLYDSWSDIDSIEPIIAEFTFGDGVVITVDVRKELEVRP